MAHQIGMACAALAAAYRSVRFRLLGRWQPAPLSGQGVRRSRGRVLLGLGLITALVGSVLRGGAAFLPGPPVPGPSNVGVRQVTLP